MSHTKRVSFLLLTAVVVFVCAHETGNGEAAVQEVLPQEAFVTSHGVRLSYLDWGGEGPSLVLIHGFGGTPHVFEHLARDLSTHFRVIAYARRGHGHSDSPEGPYDNRTLTEDLRTVMDSLGIVRAHLLGWSMGGNEITEFGGRYPDRVGKLVYLEAGYDWSDAENPLDSMPITPWPDSASLASLSAYRAWSQSTWGVGLPWNSALESDLRARTRIGTNGRVQIIPSPAATEKLFESLGSYVRDYAAVKAPALALYSEDFIGIDIDGSTAAERVNRWERGKMDSFREVSIERIRNQLLGVTVKQVPNTTHNSIAFHDQESLVATLHDFLLASQ